MKVLGRRNAICLMGLQLGMPKVRSPFDHKPIPTLSPYQTLESVDADAALGEEGCSIFIESN